MKPIYVQATLKNLDLLVELRIKDLQLFSDKTVSAEMIDQIRSFYKTKMEEGNCTTILGYDSDTLVSTATIYFYSVLPSNENPIGIVGQITSIWVDERYRRQGIASNLIDQLIDIGKQKAGMICLNASVDALNIYYKKGFKQKENYLVYIF